LAEVLAAVAAPAWFSTAAQGLWVAKLDSQLFSDRLDNQPLLHLSDIVFAWL